ncbi:MAG: alpha/beta hydrolase [Croceibacterium sp.]
MKWGRAIVAGLGLLFLGTPASAQTVGTVTLRSVAMKQERTINIYVPPSYEAGKRRYPVLYMTDGGLRDGFAPMATLIEQGIAAGTIGDVILVGIAQRDRDNELVPSAKHGTAFRNFVIDEVKPWVEANFRTDGHDAIQGGSFGGLFVIHTLLHEPDAFDDYIAISPALWWKGRALVSDSRELLTNALPAPRRLWLAVANEGPAMGVDSFAAQLKKHAPPWLSWTFTPFPRETHVSVYHPAAKIWVPALFPAEK